MNKKQTIKTLFLLSICILCVLVFQLVVGGCFWWECVPNRDFHVLDWKLPAYLFPEDANLSDIHIPSEAGGEIEIGSQDIHWNKGNGIAGYDINRYATIKDLSKNKLINSDLVEWCNSIQETLCADVD